ncbi:MAG: SLBB domain-containing protein [bacterium]
MMQPSGTMFRYFLLMLALIASNADLLAQYPYPPASKKGQDFQLPLHSQGAQTDVGRERLSDIAVNVQALEAAIDPRAYVVGPGDQFLITIWSALETSFRTGVTPEGKLIIPTIGTLEVDGKSLKEVQQLVEEHGAKKYLHATISADLVQLRSFRVHVTGQVKHPGPYTALAVNRVSDIIREAGDLTSWGFERNIQVRHLDGTTDVVDLYEYRKLGNLDSNIYLRSGDVVFVPSINLSRATVRIEGRVHAPGIYQLAQDETLTDFLLRVDALNQRADLQSAYIARETEGDGVAQNIPISPYLEKTGNGYSQFHLQDGDVIIVPERHQKVYVIGAVRNPGPYPFVPNLKVRDYVGLAGSTELAANLSRSQVIRQQSKAQERGEDLLVYPGDTVFVPKRAQFGVQEIVAIVGTVTSVLISLKAVGVL